VNVKLYHHLGLLYYRAKKYADAVRQYEALMKLDPKDVYNYIEWANIYLGQKKADEAIGILESALKAGLKHADLYLALGYAHSLKEDNNSALKFFNLAQEAAPGDPRVHFYLGSFYEKIKQKETAAQELRKAIELDPEFADAYNYLGYMFAEEGSNLDEAVELVKKALEKDPDNGAYIDSLGWAYFQEGKFGEALVELEKAVKLEPDDLEIKEHLKKVRERLKKSR
jgi:tetratricopeptide (TPR) repeat protein